MRLQPLTNHGGPPDLSIVAKVLALSASSGTPPETLAERLDLSARIRLGVKAAVGAASAADIPAIVDQQTEFVETLVSRSVFVTLLTGGVGRAPMRTPIRSVSVAVTGTARTEGQPAPVSRIELAASELKPRSAMALIAMTKEAAANASPSGLAFIDTELRGAVASAVDGVFLGVAMDGITPTVSTGPDASDALRDLRAMLDTVNQSGAGSLYWTLAPDVANSASTLLNLSGGPVFPMLGPTGGELLRLPALVSDQMAPGSLALIDAGGFLAEIEDVIVERSEHVALQMRDDPENAAAALVSLWQTNGIALRATLTFAAERVRANSVAVLNGIEWGGDES